jgi:hypothetical protein
MVLLWQGHQTKTLRRKAYLGVAKARPNASPSFLKTSLAKRLAYKHKPMAEKCCLEDKAFQNPRSKP